jgi:hypothetical protein
MNRGTDVFERITPISQVLHAFAHTVKADLAGAPKSANFFLHLLDLPERIS